MDDIVSDTFRASIAEAQQRRAAAEAEIARLRSESPVDMTEAEGAIDHRAVTVETMNTSGAPDWGISEESHEGIAQLLEWAHRQWGIPLDRKHVIGHKEVPGAATACPGPSMDIDWIVARAIELNKPDDGQDLEDGVLVSREWLEQLSTDVEGLLSS